MLNNDVGLCQEAINDSGFAAVVIILSPHPPKKEKSWVSFTHISLANHI